MAGGKKRALPGGPASAAKRQKSKQCPYLDTVDRNVIDFDFEKVCSVTLSKLNVYACLVCGKFFSGRGKSTPAYTHSVEEGHYVFMKLDDGEGKMYCLPDNYPIVDPSLDDVKHNLRPAYTPEQIAALDGNSKLSIDSFGSAYLPGFVGLNNLGCTDYANALVQALAHVQPLRDFFMQRENYSGVKSAVVQAFGDLVCRMWNSKRFKATVCPHELIQAVTTASKKCFRIGHRSDCAMFASWLLNLLHRELCKHAKKRASVVFDCFQGQVEVSEGHEAKAKRVNFLHLTLDLPETPLFADEKANGDDDDESAMMMIPQISLYDILRKFNGRSVSGATQRRYIVTKTPRYLMLHIKRFSKNTYRAEKNPTIVSFPVQNLEMKPFTKRQDDFDAMGIKELKEWCVSRGASVAGVVEKAELARRARDAAGSTKYNLVSSICHGGGNEKLIGAKDKDPMQAGQFRVHVRNRTQWYEIEDLQVRETMPQEVAVSESYMLVYERAS